MNNLGSRIKDAAPHQAALYEAVFNILGDTGVILPAGDHYQGQPNAATFTTRRRSASGVEAVFTWSEPPEDFDTPLDLTAPGTWRGVAPVIELNGSDEEADSPDADYWSAGADGSGPNEPAMSFGAWIAPAEAAAMSILDRIQETTGSVEREWALQLNADGKPLALVYDDSEGAYIGRRYDTALATGRWSHLVATKGTGVTSAAVTIYLDGVAVDDTDEADGSYTAMENTDALTQLGYHRASGGLSSFFTGRIAGGPLGPFFTQAELTADQVNRLYNIGRRALAL